MSASNATAHDARRKLRAHLANEGFDLDGVFEENRR